MASSEKQVLLSIQGVKSDPSQYSDETQLLTRGSIEFHDGTEFLSFVENV